MNIFAAKEELKSINEWKYPILFEPLGNQIMKILMKIL